MIHYQERAVYMKDLRLSDAEALYERAYLDREVTRDYT